MSAPFCQSETQNRFLDWADAQNARHEFDGCGPVAMTGGNARYNRIEHNAYAALRPTR